MQQEPIAREVKSKLDGIIVNIELTLISIIQSIPLGILAERAGDPVSHFDWPVIIYLVVGLLTILLFWSRALIHTLSFIGWPLDFTHNFLYVGSTLVQCVVLSQVGNPQSWFAMWTLYAAVLWIMYAVDLRMIRSTEDQESEENGKILLQDVLDDQLLNVRFYLPIGFVASAASWWAITQWPDFFIVQGWHMALVGLQFIAGGLYLLQGYQILRRRNERILTRNVDAVE